MKIQISGLAEAIRSPMPFTHVVSVLEPALVPHLPKWNVPPERQHLAVCHDVDGQRDILGEKALPPNRQMVRRVLAFSRQLTEHHTLLVHCAYGVSRSTTTAYAILCQHYPQKSEEALLRSIVKLRPVAQPNKLIVSHADALLGRQGRMVSALEAFQVDPNVFMKTIRNPSKSRRPE